MSESSQSVSLELTTGTTLNLYLCTYFELVQVLLFTLATNRTYRYETPSKNETGLVVFLRAKNDNYV